jgi:hypothetical protein
MEAGLATHVWSLEELVGLLEPKATGGSVRAGLFLAALLCVMVSWISSLRILAKLKSLKAERYQFSDLFYPGIYEKYWEIAPQFGWSRIPVFMLPIGGLLGGLLGMLCAVT